MSILLQVSANFANDLFDFEKGADGCNRTGPPRAVASGLIKPEHMRMATGLVLMAAATVGYYLSLIGGPVFFVLGAFCLAAAVLYTAGPYPLGYLGLGDPTVFIFFGLVAVVGTFYLQTQQLYIITFIAGGGVGALTTNLLVVNNTRDRVQDAHSGKMTLAVRRGHRFSVKQYVFLLYFSYFCALLLLFHSTWTFLPLLTLPLGRKLVRDLDEKVGSALNQTLADTGNLILLYSLLLSLGVIAGQIW